MQVETLLNVPQSDAKSYLRTATIASKTALCFLYIGNNPTTSDLLGNSFRTGFFSEDLEGARKILAGPDGAKVDALIIDIPYNTDSLRTFQAFLKNHDLLSIPVLYSNSQVKKEYLVENEVWIDDVIDLERWQGDFFTKISFLKKSKQYQSAGKTPKVNIEPRRSLAKRAFDIFVAGVLLLLLTPVLLLIALAIRFESKGPIFYVANRAGRGFKIFKFYKFRTMEVNADKKIDALAHLNQYEGSTAGARFFKISNDPRITKVGKFLRNTSLDELPQLINVLKGDMSLVGNRPLPLYEAATLTTNEFVERFMAPAGITGLWQIKKRGKSNMSIDERIELDISYARKGSLMYDFWIMAKTPAALFQQSDV